MANGRVLSHMSQRHVYRDSDNSYIDRIWATENITDGIYKATPDGCWDLIMIIANGKTQMMLTGQASKTTMVPYKAGTSAVVISFTAGAYMPQMSGPKMLDLIEMLPNSGDDHFILLNQVFKFPTYENAEELVQDMETRGLLAMDDVVAAVLQGNPKAMSDRNMQRHFIKATGLTRKSLDQIHRAQQVVTLIKQGSPLDAAAAEAGYSDQPHLTKSLKKIMHSRPSDVEDIHKL